MLKRKIAAVVTAILVVTVLAGCGEHVTPPDNISKNGSYDSKPPACEMVFFLGENCDLQDDWDEFRNSSSTAMDVREMLFAATIPWFYKDGKSISGSEQVEEGMTTAYEKLSAEPAENVVGCYKDLALFVISTNSNAKVGSKALQDFRKIVKVYDRKYNRPGKIVDKLAKLQSDDNGDKFSWSTVTINATKDTSMGLVGGGFATCYALGESTPSGGGSPTPTTETLSVVELKRELLAHVMPLATKVENLGTKKDGTPRYGVNFSGSHLDYVLGGAMDNLDATVYDDTSLPTDNELVCYTDWLDTYGDQTESDDYDFWANVIDTHVDLTDTSRGAANNLSGGMRSEAVDAAVAEFGVDEVIAHTPGTYEGNSLELDLANCANA